MGKFSVLVLCVGIPGSGKTSWIKEYIKSHPLTYVVSTDEIRKELTGVEQCIDPSQNEMIHEEARKRVKIILGDPNSLGGLGPEIIVDSTNVDFHEWQAYKELAPSIMLAKIFDITVDEAMKHQEQRERRVPREIVEMKYNQLQESKKYISFYFNMIL